MPGSAQVPPGIVALDSRAVRVAIGRRLRKLRRERGISQEQLARRAGMHTPVISRLERGAREPRATMLLRLSHGLEVPPGMLLDELPMGGEAHDDL